MVDFTIVYNRYKARLYNFVLKMVSDRMVCDDIIQDVFMKLYKNLDRIRNKNSILYWLFKTTRNEIYDYYRSKYIKVDQFNVADTDNIELEASENVELEVEHKELKDMIFAELDKMDVAQREVYLLKEYGGLSYKEISAVMGIDEKLVKSRLYKTRQKLIKRFEKII
ncbi:RNA polymerase sigma factor [Bacteroidota bacterium]